MYASLLRISGVLHLALFEQPRNDDFLKVLVGAYAPWPYLRYSISDSRKRLPNIPTFR